MGHYPGRVGAPRRGRPGRRPRGGRPGTAWPGHSLPVSGCVSL